MLQISSLLAIPISQSLLPGHAQGSLDYPACDIIFLNLQGPRIIDYRHIVI